MQLRLASKVNSSHRALRRRALRSSSSARCSPSPPSTSKRQQPSAAAPAQARPRPPRLTQSRRRRRRKISAGCISCHTATDSATMHPPPTPLRIGCTDCHLGDASITLHGEAMKSPAYDEAQTRRPRHPPLRRRRRPLPRPRPRLHRLAQGIPRLHPVRQPRRPPRRRTTPADNPAATSRKPATSAPA